MGITTAIIPYARGVGFAVPASTAPALARFQEMRSSVQARDGVRLGIGGAAAENGVLVLEVLPDSPAARASLRPEDVIVAVAGHPVRTSQDLMEALRPLRAGQSVEVTFLRGSRQGRTTVILYIRGEVHCETECYPRTSPATLSASRRAWSACTPRACATTSAAGLIRAGPLAGARAAVLAGGHRRGCGRSSGWCSELGVNLARRRGDPAA